MEHLNRQFLFDMTPEQRENYRQDLEYEIAKLTIFLAQVRDVQDEVGGQ